MVRIVVILVMIVTAAVTSVVYHVTQKADMEYYQGHRYFEKGKYAQALPHYQRSLAINPSHVNALKDLGYIYSWTGKLDAADAAFKKVLSLRPDDVPVKIALAETLSWQKRYPESIALLRQVVGQGQGEKASLDLAEVYQWGGQFKKSKEMLDTLTGEQSKSIKARLLYAKALLYSGDPAGAVPLLEALLSENAVKKNKELAAEAEGLLAETSIIGKDYAKAIERYRKQVLENPQDVKPRIILADMLSWVQRYDESIAEYRKALEIEPGNREAKRKLARVYSWAQDYVAAERLFREAIAADPKDIESTILLADMFSWQKRYDEAIAGYNKALRITGQDPETMNKLAQIASWSKDYGTAERIYSANLAKDPGATKVRAALAEVLSWQHNYPASIDAYEKVLSAEPNNLQIKFALAQVYSWNKDYEKAEKLYREILVKDPGNMPVRLALGELLLWQSKNQEAVNYFKALLDEQDERAGKQTK